jgi:hypothetical protein
VPPGATFETSRAWILPQDSTDRERCGLAVRRMMRTVAPWVTENPLMMHVVSSHGPTVTNAIDQCAATGFEMIILSFGSGFDMENERPETLQKAQAFAAYARSRGIEIGSYSLLASRSVGGGHDVVMPPGLKPVFGNSPCLQSRWARTTSDACTTSTGRADSPCWSMTARTPVIPARPPITRGTVDGRTPAGTNGWRSAISTAGAAVRGST